MSVGLLIVGGGFATGGSHFGLRRRALFITTFVCLSKLQKFSVFSEGSQNLESPCSSHFHIRVPSGLRHPGCRHLLLGEIDPYSSQGFQALEKKEKQKNFTTPGCETPRRKCNLCQVLSSQPVFPLLRYK